MNNIQLPDLPIKPELPELIAGLKLQGKAELSAAPGAGKTTLVPLALLLDGAFKGKILLLEPRRVAARAAAARMATLLGERIGERVGYLVRGDSRQSNQTKILVVTDGILVRLLQDDPNLTDFGTIIFDEFHERTLNIDLGLTLTLEVRENLRPDLKILIMSATLELNRTARFLGGASAVIAPGKLFPIEIRWSEKAIDLRRPAPAVARACYSLYQEKPGDMLVFLPGMREIQEVATLLQGALPPTEALILPLHGSLTLAQQEAALAPAPEGKRKIILSTNLAESSLTIDGVTLVVDSGLERRLRFSPAIGIPQLETCRISEESAEQRAGRAGRTAPGTVVRLWSKSDHCYMQYRTTPEILEAELTTLALELALWGAKPEQLRWLNRPPEANYAAAIELLQELGALDKNGKLTNCGRQLAEMPIHPRLGVMLLAAAERGEAPLAAEIAAILEERDLPGHFHSVDLIERIEQMRRNQSKFKNQWAIKQQLLRILKTPDREIDLSGVGRLTALAFPDRIGRARNRHSEKYLLTSGQEAVLPPGDELCQNEFLAVARLTGNAGSSNRIELAAALDRSELEAQFRDQFYEETVVEFDESQARFSARREVRLGKLVMSSAPTEPPPGAIPAAVLTEAISRGIELPPPEQKAAVALLKKVNFAVAQQNEEFPDWSPTNWGKVLPEIALPFLNDVRSLADLRKADWLIILQSALGENLLQKLKREMPDFFTTPAGANHRIDYSQEQPTLSVRVQELYGLTRHPTIGQGKIPLRLELLSPAHRPVQITTDLPRFWAGSWKLVQKEMRGRYPKHFWPDDPANAAPGTRLKDKPKA